MRYWVTEGSVCYHPLPRDSNKEAVEDFVSQSLVEAAKEELTSEIFHIAAHSLVHKLDGFEAP
jgi:hypothetical protein